MRWNRVHGRNGRNAKCLNLESLESRQLLSTTQPNLQAWVDQGGVQQTQTPQEPKPAGSSAVAPVAAYDSIIGATATRSAYGVDGSGLTVAVIDTGVNYNHEALGGGFGAGHKVIAGYDFAMNDADPFAQTWEHGTAVSGLIASSDPQHLGVAPGADIVALRVFGNDNQGSYDSIANALKWVIDNHSKYHISVVNLSIADGGNYTQNIFAGDGGVGQRITSLVAQLKAINIPVVSATGNSFTGQAGVGFTSIIPDTISVTATDGATNLASDAQRLGGPNGTDVAAPGTGLVAPIQGNQFQSVDGTSFATALVSGSVVLLQQIYMKQFGVLPSVSQVEGWLRSGGETINDPSTGISLSRLDLPKTAALEPVAPKPTVVIPTVTTPTTTKTAPVVAPTAVTKPIVVTTQAQATTTPKSTSTSSNVSPVVSTTTTNSAGTATTTYSGWISNLAGTFKTWRSWTVKVGSAGSANPGPSQPAGTFEQKAAKPNHGTRHPKGNLFVRKGTTKGSQSKVV